jgi:hypothetical protein
MAKRKPLTLSQIAALVEEANTEGTQDGDDLGVAQSVPASARELQDVADAVDGGRAYAFRFAIPEH